jgi:hypothetical protein
MITTLGFLGERAGEVDGMVFLGGQGGIAMNSKTGRFQNPQPNPQPNAGDAQVYTVVPSPPFVVPSPATFDPLGGWGRSILPHGFVLEEWRRQHIPAGPPAPNRYAAPPPDILVTTKDLLIERWPKSKINAPKYESASERTGNSKPQSKKELQKLIEYKLNLYDTALDKYEVRGLDCYELPLIGRFPVTSRTRLLTLPSKVEGVGGYRAEKGSRFGLGGETNIATGDSSTVFGGEQFGITLLSNYKVPGATAYAGVKDGSLKAEGEVWAFLLSLEPGLNILGYNVRLVCEYKCGAEVGVSAGQQTKVKVGPFAVGVTFGDAIPAHKDADCCD